MQYAAHMHGPCGPKFFAMHGPRRRHWGGPGPGGGFGFGPGGGPRARRGDVRATILALLAEEPRNGYQIIQEIEERTKGLWRPSPGAVYPALSVLTDEGLVRESEADGKRTFELTDEGRKHVGDNDPGKPWEAVTEGYSEAHLGLGEEVRQLMGAFRQVASSRDEGQIEKAKAILADARKALYRLLAGDES
jgi:DNA-binding PadR family transcriptional regulator